MADIALAPVLPLPTLKPGRDKTAAERQRRYRARNKEPATAVAPPPVTPTVTVGHSLAGRNVTAGVNVAAYAAAIALAGVAAVFSIRGMVVLFPGAPSTVAAMAATLRTILNHGTDDMMQEFAWMVREDAVEKAIKRAHKTIKNLSWFQVVETRGNIEKGKVHHWQVTIKVGFTVED